MSRRERLQIMSPVANPILMPQIAPQKYNSYLTNSSHHQQVVDSQITEIRLNMINENLIEGTRKQAVLAKEERLSPLNRVGKSNSTLARSSPARQPSMSSTKLLTTMSPR